MSDNMFQCIDNFLIDDWVRILDGLKYDGKYKGCLGTIRRILTPKRSFAGYGVKIAGISNPVSKDGLFLFAADDLELIPCPNLINSEPEENKMKQTPRSVRTMLANGITGRSFNIDKVIYSGPKTIILWTDGTKTIASCGDGQTYDPYYGFCAAVTKKVFGSKHQVDKIVNRAVKDAEHRVKDVKANARS